jgi:hypothetical protein
MRILIIAIQVVLSFVVTASIMPIILVSVPATTEDHRLGLSLMGVLFVLSFAVIALVWPGRKRPR